MEKANCVNNYCNNLASSQQYNKIPPSGNCSVFLNLVGFLSLLMRFRISRPHVNPHSQLNIRKYLVKYGKNTFLNANVFLSRGKPNQAMFRYIDMIYGNKNEYLLYT